MLNTRNRLILPATLAATSLLLTGCLVTVPPPQLPDTVVPRHVAVLSPGIEIVDESGEWALSGSDPVKPPFLTQSMFQTSGKGILDAYEQSLAAGAKLVRVKVPTREKPLYGVLSLGRVFATSSETSAKRTYRIAIPEQRIQDALGGQVSVVYQPYEYEHDTVAIDDVGNQFYAPKTATSASWVLWLSDAPFPGQEASAATPNR